MRTKNWKKFVAFALAGIMVFGSTSVPQVNAKEEIFIDKSSGTCGENLNWELDSVGLLYIHGTGNMEDYSDAKAAPWDRTKVKKVVMSKQVQSIGNKAFYGCNSLESIKMSEELTHIGELAFGNASKLTEVILPESLQSIGDLAFYGCFSLESLEIPRGVTEIGQDIFADCAEEFKIHCYTDTTAHQYAISNRIPYELLDKPADPPTDTPTDTPTDKPADPPTDTPVDKPTDTPTVNPNVQYLSNAAVTLSATEYIYDGAAKTPEVTVLLDGKTLAKNIDYIVTYMSNTDIGVGIVTINGCGNYAGTIVKLFYIVQKEAIDIGAAEVTLSKSAFYYDGKKKSPSVTVEVDSVVLEENVDYQVSYSRNINIGTAKVKIQGIGDYAGTVEKTFTIKGKKGAVYTIGGCKYQITGGDTVAFTGIQNSRSTSVRIPKSVRIGGKNLKVTAIKDKALAGKSKIRSITIGENIITIGKDAFKNCKKLNEITIKSTKLKKVGKNALKGIRSHAKIRVPAKKLTTYTMLFKSKGQGKKVQIIK